MSNTHTDFFENNSLEFIEMALSTDRIEKPSNPDGYGKRVGDCGDIVEFYLCFSNNIINSVSFTTQGCLKTVACSNTVAKFTEGKTLEQAWDITPETVIDYLKTLPEDHAHCAQLAVGAMYLALSDIESKKKKL